MALTAQARAADSVLLFYNSGTGLAATGRVDANGNYADLRTFKLDRGWRSIVPTGNGLVLFYDRGKAVTGRFQADGSFQNLQSYAGFEKTWSQIASTSDGILLFYRRPGVYNEDGTPTVPQEGKSEGQPLPGLAATGRIDANGNFGDLGTFDGFDPWSHVVPTHSGLVLFYQMGTGQVTTGRVQPDGSFHNLRDYTGFDRTWYHIVSTSDGILLFYNSAAGALVLGRVDENGNYAGIRSRAFQGGLRLIPTTNGRVLFYNPQTGLSSFGRFDARGAFTVGPLVKLDAWTHIVPVR
jgi:hypothetical protein